MGDVRTQGATLEFELLVRRTDADGALQRKDWVRRVSELIERTYGVRIGVTVRVA